MTEREKVIKGLECLTQRQEPTANPCKECGYINRPNYAICVKDIASDALELLKAQEPVKPYIDYDGQDVWRCGSCGATLFHLSHTQADEIEQNCVKFCRYCGKAVKWDE
jgi:hypothetical protein